MRKRTAADRRSERKRQRAVKIKKDELRAVAPLRALQIWSLVAYQSKQTLYIVHQDQLLLDNKPTLTGIAVALGRFAEAV